MLEKIPPLLLPALQSNTRGQTSGIYEALIYSRGDRETNGLIYRGLNLNVYDFDKISR